MNSWNIHNALHKTRPLELKQFHEELCIQLYREAKQLEPVLPRKRTRPSGVEAMHQPLEVGKKSACAQCAKFEKRLQTIFICNTCDVPLHINCFIPYHMDWFIREGEIE